MRREGLSVVSREGLSVVVKFVMSREGLSFVMSREGLSFVMSREGLSFVVKKKTTVTKSFPHSASDRERLYLSCRTTKEERI